MSPPSTAPEETPLSHAELVAFFDAYLLSINSGHVGTELARFCPETVRYNDRTLTRAAYQANIDAAFTHMPDARFAIALLAADSERQCVALRLSITGTLRAPFMGVEPSTDGGKAHFYEHVFYELKGGRIQSVKTLIKPGKLPVVEP